MKLNENNHLILYFLNYYDGSLNPSSLLNGVKLQSSSSHLYKAIIKFYVIIFIYCFYILYTCCPFLDVSTINISEEILLS